MSLWGTELKSAGRLSPQPHEQLNPKRDTTHMYYRGVNNYLYYFGGSFLWLWHNGPQNPILIFSAPRVCTHEQPQLRPLYTATLANRRSSELSFGNTQQVQP